jgi:oxygen-independent coproporphyrinogen-3 oxidase
MALSVYVHIPYCLQRCRYCDFTTFEQSEILAPRSYVDWILQEIRLRHSFWKESQIRTLYFGGGTPSLLAPELIVAIYQELANVGYSFTPDCEVTIEINPATLTEASLNQYMQAGFNRFSVGAQTFDDALLKACGRRHDAEDTRDTLNLLHKYHLNYSFDLLFALPKQNMSGLRRDLEEVAGFSPPHLSAYCLTIPEGHPMSLGRPPEEEQVEMFAEITASLQKTGLHKYEISNFARPGFESRHNLAYWNDSNYWGIGLSSHSYQQNYGDFGMRFWNPKSLTEYGMQTRLKKESFTEVLPPTQYEKLDCHESLTDFCHMFLRTQEGLSVEALRKKFGATLTSLVESRLEKLRSRGLLQAESQGTSPRFSLTPQGELISNKVFEELAFLADDISASADRAHTLTGVPENTYCSV